MFNVNMAYFHSKHVAVIQEQKSFYLQEVEIINNVQDLLKKTIDQSDKQIK